MLATRTEKIGFEIARCLWAKIGNSCNRCEPVTLGLETESSGNSLFLKTYITSKTIPSYLSYDTRSLFVRRALPSRTIHHCGTYDTGADKICIIHRACRTIRTLFTRIDLQTVFASRRPLFAHQRQNRNNMCK